MRTPALSQKVREAFLQHHRAPCSQEQMYGVVQRSLQTIAADFQL
jgi:hypothetical protein